MIATTLPLLRISEIISRLDYFQGVAADTLRRLAASARYVHVRRDEPVFRRGEPADTLHVVVSGQIKVFLPQPNAGEKVVALVAHGESFGVAPLWLGLAHAADAVANQDSHLLLLERAALLREARQDCILAGRLMDAVSHRVMDLMRNLESCARRSARQRVACYLLQHRPQPAGDAYEVHLPATRREVAAKLNLTQETFSRVLRQLSQDGMVEMQGRVIRVLSAPALERLNPGGDAVRSD